MSGSADEPDRHAATGTRRDHLLLALYPRHFRSGYGEEMLAASRERTDSSRWPTATDVIDLLLGAVQVHLWRLRDADHAPLRGGSAIVGVLAPVILLTGLGTDVHEVAWFVWYSGFTDLPWRQAAPDAPVWLAWAIVAPLALLGRRRTAAVAAWLATAGMVVAIAIGAMLPTPLSSGQLLLALLAAVALTFSPDAPRGVAVVGMRRFLPVLGAVVLVLFARLLGRHFVLVDVVAWVALGVAIAYACRPRTMAGRRAIVLLSAPATSAAGAAVLELGVFALHVVPFTEAWPLVAGAFYGAPLVVLSTLALLLRRLERSGSFAAAPE
ncbi:MAG: hypothetical protein ACR2JQ_07810 [Mycobacteriales bacterium]